MERAAARVLHVGAFLLARGSIDEREGLRVVRDDRVVGVELRSRLRHPNSNVELLPRLDRHLRWVERDEHALGVNVRSRRDAEKYGACHTGEREARHRCELFFCMHAHDSLISRP